MNNNNSNGWKYTGNVKFSPTLRTSAGGKSFLSVTVDDGNSGMSAIMFGVMAEAFNVMTGQGNAVNLQGYINQRKDAKTGYYQNSLICQAFSVDGGASWHTEQSLKGQQQAQNQPQQQSQPQNAVYLQEQQGRKPPEFQQQQQQQIPMQQQQVRPQAQQSQQFQQPQVNQQVEHLQQCQSQFQQQPAQQPIEGFQDKPGQQEAGISKQAVEVQNSLYSAHPQQSAQQQNAAVQSEIDDFDSQPIPF